MENDANKKPFSKWFKEIIQNNYATLFLTLLIPFFVGLAPVWDSWFGDANHGHFFKEIYKAVDNNFWINIPVTILLSYSVFCWICRIWEDEDFRLFRIPLVINIITILLCCEDTKFANVFWIIDYRWLLVVLCCLIFLVTSIKAYNICIKNKRSSNLQKISGEESIRKGFSNDTCEENDNMDNLKSYASVIVDKLMATDVKVHSYAFGITGEWGVGKTTFLNLLKKELEGKAEIIEFNPWICHSPEQLIQDFFDTLSGNLSRKYSTLSKSIKEYANCIKGISLTPSHSLRFDFNLGSKAESLFQKKNDLSKKLSNLRKPIAIIIDDIDRLEREEVFEVLRLIRNTGDLKNTIYIAAYDKEYVRSVLEEKNIKNASAYLEKIFQVEIHLPKVESEQIIQLFKTDIDVQTDDDISSLSDKNFAESLIVCFDQDERQLIFRVLNNYRRAKLFARLYTLTISYLRKDSVGEFAWLGVFWLELLHFYDVKTYNVLANDQNLLLYVDNDRYRLRPGIFDSRGNDSKVYNGKQFWKNETPVILHKMFGYNIGISQISISKLENFPKYFTLCVSPHKLSIKEFRDFIVQKNKTPKNLVKQWISNGKYVTSIIYQFKYGDVDTFDNNGLKNYIYGLLNLGIYNVNSRIFQEIKSLLVINRYKKNTSEAHEFILAWMHEKIESNYEVVLLSKLLNLLYGTITYDESYQKKEPLSLLICNEEIESLLTEIMKAFLDAHPKLTVLDLIEPKSELGKLFANCSVLIDEQIKPKYKQVAYDIVIKNFSEKDSKISQEDFQTAYGMNGMILMENKYWGSSQDKEFEKFKTNCLS